MQHIGRIILGVAESDCHAVANQLIHFMLEDHGYKVTNLGVCTPVSEFVEAAAGHADALAIAIGTTNGHAYQDLKPLRRYRDRLPCSVIVGGNLSVGAVKSGSDADRLRELGVDCILRSADELLGCLDRLRGVPAWPAEMAAV
ncbi:cobalamin-dependent protein [Streptomyces sp. NPDC004296]|uniref:cobalamin-dependent protein n=1 Tax=Streptomyces sp. NPDC004296 TaxID=3364697 RepID=UPI003690FC96